MRRKKVNEEMSKKKISNNTSNKMDNTSFYPDISNTVSASECTGMMYAPPQSEAEFESYQELFQMQIPKNEDEEEKTNLTE